MGKKNFSGLGVFGIIAFIIIIIIIEPALWFWLGYFGGWLTKLIIGTKLVTAINMVFGTTFTVDMLPMMAGALNWIGSFFKNINSIRKDK